jgi:hypothetical protein
MWPEDLDYIEPPFFQRELRIPRNSLRHRKPDLKYQRDIVARDRAIDLEDLRRQTSFPMPSTRKILARPMAPAKPIVLEE